MCSSHRLSSLTSLPSDVMCLQVFAHNLFLTRQVFCVCFCDRTLSTVIGWIRNLLRREQKTTDFMPETDEMQMFSPVHCQIFCLVLQSPDSCANLCILCVAGVRESDEVRGGCRAAAAFRFGR